MDKVKAIASSLSRAGCDVWQDTDKIMGGDRIIAKISQALSETEYYLAFVSWSSIHSPYFIFELSMAVSLQVRKEKPIIIPVTMDDAPIPDMLEGLKYIKFGSVAQTTKEIIEKIQSSGKYEISTADVDVERKRELTLSSFSFYLCEETRSINSFEYHELEEKIHEINTNLKKTANMLVLPFVSVDDIELTKPHGDVNFPNVSFNDILNDRGAKDVLYKEICLETEILNPDQDKIIEFISSARENVKSVKYIFLFPSPIPNLAEKTIKKLLKERKDEIGQWDSESISYIDEGKKYTVSCTDQQVRIKIDSPMPLIRNADINKFDITRLVKNLVVE
jgi:hypothetical protein